MERSVFAGTELERMERVSLDELKLLQRIRQLDGGTHVILVEREGKGKLAGLRFVVQEAQLPERTN
jgi:hypothetical protein